MLLKAAAAKARARVIAPQIRHPLSLLLTLLALLTITIGLAGPRCGESAGGRTVVVVDRSGVMQRQARRGGAVAERALDELDLLLDGIGPLESVALVDAGPVPLLSVGVTRDVARVRAGARARGPTGRVDLPAAVRLADELCEDPASDRILLVSGGAPGPLPETRCPVSRVGLVQAEPNVGIAVLAARRADGLGLLEVAVGVAGDLAAELPFEVAIRVDGRLVDTISLDLPAGGTAWAVRRLDVPGEVVEAEILDLDDGNPADDRGVAVQPAERRVRVGLVTDSPDGFTATALRLHPEVQLQVVPPAESRSLAGFDLVVLETAAEIPAVSHVVALGPGPAAAVGIGVGEPIEAPVLTRWAFDSPVLRFVDLDDLVLRRAQRLQPVAGTSAVIEAAGLPVAVVGRIGERRVFATGFDPDASDLVLRVDFLHLLANLVEWAVDRGEEPRPAELGRVWAAGNADDLLMAESGGTPGWSPLVRTGVHEVISQRGDDARGRIAPLAPGVASVAATGVGSLDAVPVAAAGGAAGWPWWLWGVLAALAFLLAETAMTGGLWWLARFLGRNT